MITNIFDQLKIVRWWKGGEWVLTKKRRWIDSDTYEEYLDYGFDPIMISIENYK